MKKVILRSAIVVSVLASSASADGLTYGFLSGQYVDGETSNDGVDGSFQSYTRLEGEAEYVTGAFTFYGQGVLDTADFTATENGEEFGSDVAEAGAEYRFSQFALGVNASRFIPTVNDTSVALDSLALYGQYEADNFYMGAAAFTSDVDDIDFGEDGFAVFGGYDNGAGFEIGGQLTETEDVSFYSIYAAYTAANFELEADWAREEFDNENVFDMFSVSGATYITQNVAIIGGVMNLSLESDGTTEWYVGGRYNVAEDYSLELAYYDFDAFNGFTGDGVSFTASYEVGKQRRGYQSVAEFYDTSLAPIFFSF
ncbi:MAG: hypothetical protein AAGI10_02050 [Pseudomonadota bacterium]